MQIFLIDPDAAALTCMEQALRKARPEAALLTFSGGHTALAAIENGNQRPDVVFCEVDMPGMSGLELAVQLRNICSFTKIIFVTNSTEYAAAAYQIHADGYVIKPLLAERADDEMKHLEQLQALPTEAEKLVVRCFGYFEVFWKGKPLHFQRQQSKELLAYLISRDGAACTSGEISAALWEEECAPRLTGNRIRTLLSDLRPTLRHIGMEDVLIRHRGSIAIDRSRIDCDFYRMQNGEPAAIHAFHGQFMQQYSWAEAIAGTLLFGSFGYN